jgi:hypothetical protein
MVDRCGDGIEAPAGPEFDNATVAKLTERRTELGVEEILRNTKASRSLMSWLTGMTLCLL